MSTVPFVRRPAFIIGTLLILLAFSVWLNVFRPSSVDLPRLDPQTLSDLTASRDDRQQLLVHLSSLLYRRPVRLAPWSELPAAAQPVWSTLLLELALEPGGGSFPPAQEEGAPTPMDAAAGYEAMGATEMAGMLRELLPGIIDAQHPPAPAVRAAFDRRYKALLPKAQGARLAYLKTHAEAISSP